ncbi:hypothetical protein HMPREF2568_04420 [Neisseria sp. HMSC059F02]|jgi:hypothetical protein|nr:hypothetical protein HMPREF2638_10425 [Neisseria sp. HMSC055F11]OFN34076.1 hypothetical protein HMPREF2568_04420 [Neisseria sp. HMSC059F02]
MISNEMKFRQLFESYVIVGVPLLSVLIFILTPSHADDEILIRLNEFLDEYLFGNGYYKPSAYPLAAKVTNSFSVILSIGNPLYMFGNFDGDLSKKRCFYAYPISFCRNVCVDCFNIALYLE